jgi:anti-sigma factor RsiW
MMDERTRLEMEVARYVDGEMTPDERAALEKHLAADWSLDTGRDLITSAELRRMIDKLTALRPRVGEALRAATGSIEGERIWRNVADRIAARPSVLETFVGGFRLFFQRRVAVGLVATAAVLIAVLLVINALVQRGTPGIGEAAAEVTIEYGDNPDVMATVDQDTDTGVVIVSVDGIEVSEVN